MKRTLALTALGVTTLFMVFSFLVVRNYSAIVLTFNNTTSYLASVFSGPSITVADLQMSSTKADEGQGKVNVLIVPGHEPDFGGAEYRDIKERNITVKIGEDMQGFFNSPAADNRYSVNITRDSQDWDPIFKSYFAAQWPTIADWVKQHEQVMTSYIANGLVSRVTNVYHNDAPTDVALRLYAINKWIDENNVDIAIHIHINDNPGHPAGEPGKYSGFVIYMPEKQYSNAPAARAVADSVFKRLSRYFPVSDLPEESAGEVEDQDLIAVGSNNTSEAASMLIEYGYIYEPMFATPAMQDIVSKELAYQTYLGVQDFFGKENDPTDGGASSSVATLPYQWNTDEYQSKSPLSTTPMPDIFAMQIALENMNYYPPAGFSGNDCPLTGIFGPCTMKALTAFQKDNGVTGENFFGPETRAIFNQRFAK